MFDETAQKKVFKQYEVYLAKILPARIPIEKACFYHSIAMKLAIDKLTKMRSVIAAGSATFLAVPEELDDGVSPTHYSYVYEGWDCFPWELPELHCWVAGCDVDGKIYLIDPTVKYVPSLAEDLGIKWRTPKPPKCLWVEPSNLPKGWHYVPDQAAMANVNAIVQKLYGN